MNLPKKQKNKSTFKSFFKNPIIIDSILSIFVFLVMILILTNPKKFTSGTISGLTLFFNSVLPGLFPFMLLTKILTEIGAIYKLSYKCDKFTRTVFGTSGISLYAFLMSILSGYPIGAKIIGDLYQKNLITSKEAQMMSVFCTTSGPIFVMGTVGAIMLKSLTFGIILYASHILSSLFLGIINGLIFKRKNKEEVLICSKPLPTPPKSKNIIADCLAQTVNALFVVGAYITMFYLVAEIFDSLKIFDMIINSVSPIITKAGGNSEYVKGVIYGILEVTRGASTLSVFADKTAITLTCGILSFSGLSIIMQSMAFLKPAGVKTLSFILYKFLHMCLAMLICTLLLFAI